MTCEQVLLAIDAYLDEEVTPLEALTVEDHLRECDACRRVVETQASLHALLAADALQDEPPARLRPRIISLITAEASRPGSSLTMRGAPGAGSRTDFAGRWWFRPWRGRERGSSGSGCPPWHNAALATSSTAARDVTRRSSLSHA